MPNKAINQLVYTPDRTDDDRHYIVRSATDYQILGASFAPKLEAASVLIPSAQVLTLFTTPVQVVPAAPAGYINIPIGGTIEFSGGGADYATNTTLLVGSTSALTSSVYTLVGSIADRSTANAAYLPSGAAVSPTIEADSLSVMIQTGNPTAGDSDILVTVYYNILAS